MSVPSSRGMAYRTPAAGLLATVGVASTAPVRICLVTSTAKDRRATRHPSRRPGSRVVVLAAVPMLFVAAPAAWWVTSPRQEVPVPPVSASPDAVVRSYLEASTAHDVDTMNALVEGDHVGRASRFDPTWTVRDVKTSPPVPDPWTGDKNTSYPEVVHVDVNLHMIKGHSLNFPDDTDTYWGYILGRRSSADPWRILEQGVL